MSVKKEEDIQILVEYDATKGYSASLVVMGKKMIHFTGDEYYSQEQARALAQRVASELGLDDEVKDSTRNKFERVQPSD
jgi:hypothetical protein